MESIYGMQCFALRFIRKINRIKKILKIVHLFCALVVLLQSHKFM